MSPPPFRNEPALELRRAAVRESLGSALGELEAQLPLDVPVLVGGDAGGAEGIDSTDPGSPARLVARAGRAGAREIDAALKAAQRAFASGRPGRPATERRRCSPPRPWMRERRLELAALEVRECAKPWPEADADVCEAIDFLEYYARDAIRLEEGRELLQVRGERNELRYAPRGVVAVISPWNFPLAIPCGMTAAALATGNAVVLKPAEQSPVCALKLCVLLHAGRCAGGRPALLPGRRRCRRRAGRATRRVHVVAFTGSSEVGLEIIAQPPPSARGSDMSKRVIAEMGGKNAMIVDADADLDDAVLGAIS